MSDVVKTTTFNGSGEMEDIRCMKLDGDLIKRRIMYSQNRAEIVGFDGG